MSDARGYVYDEGIGLRMVRQNTYYKNGSEWKRPFKVHYLDIRYEEDKNGNPLFDTDGKKKVKSKKWEPFVHAIPLPGETITGFGTGNHFVRYVGLRDLSTTVNLSPLIDLGNKGYDTDAICSMNGDVAFDFYRQADNSTIRNISFYYDLGLCHRVKDSDTEFTDVVYRSLGGGWDNGQGNSFSIKVRCKDLRYLSNLTSAERLVLVWTDEDSSGFNNGWNPDISTGYSLTF